MKVTVCFGAIRIVVPCGNGDLLVKDLINEATRRYKKAAGKVSNRKRMQCKYKCRQNDSQEMYVDDAVILIDSIGLK